MIHIVVGCVKLPNKTPSRKFLPDLKANTIRRKGRKAIRSCVDCGFRVEGLGGR